MLEFIVTSENMSSRYLVCELAENPNINREIAKIDCKVFFIILSFGYFMGNIT